MAAPIAFATIRLRGAAIRQQMKQLLNEAMDVEGLKGVLGRIQDGSIRGQLRPTDQQFDIGPKTSELFEKEVGEFLELDGAVAFHNGVFGMFEDPRFEEGTRRFMKQLKKQQLVLVVEMALLYKK